MPKSQKKSHAVRRSGNSKQSGRYAPKKKPGPKSAFDRFMDLANSGTPESHREGARVMRDASRNG